MVEGNKRKTRFVPLPEAESSLQSAGSIGDVDTLPRREMRKKSKKQKTTGIHNQLRATLYCEALTE
jgi:hypothetical protein